MSEQTSPKMPISSEVQAYIKRQPSLAWRREIFLFILRAVVRVLIKFTVTGKENIPRSGPTILMMNHIAAIDPGLCMGAVKGRYVVPMSKIENFKAWNMGPFLWWYGAYSIRRGEVDRDALTVAAKGSLGSTLTLFKVSDIAREELLRHCLVFFEKLKTVDGTFVDGNDVVLANEDCLLYTSDAADE